MWKLPSLSENSEYVLCFCQDAEDRRFCSVVESNASHPFEVARTPVVPNDLLRKRDSESISKQYKLLPHNLHFEFGPHGEWFTQPEADALFGHKPQSAIPWLTGRSPNLPPK